jgi:hypothetical protein
MVEFLAKEGLSLDQDDVRERLNSALDTLDELLDSVSSGPAPEPEEAYRPRTNGQQQEMLRDIARGLEARFGITIL